MVSGSSQTDLEKLRHMKPRWLRAYVIVLRPCRRSKAYAIIMSATTTREWKRRTVYKALLGTQNSSQHVAVL